MKSIKYWKIVGLLLVSLFSVTGCLGTLFDQPPEPVISIADGSPYGPAPSTITFDISKSYDPDGEIVSFTFDFGDGSTPIHGTDLSTPIIHTYTDAGTHTARLTVVDDKGKQRSISLVIAVSSP